MPDSRLRRRTEDRSSHQASGERPGAHMEKRGEIAVLFRRILFCLAICVFGSSPQHPFQPHQPFCLSDIPSSLFVSITFCLMHSPLHKRASKLNTVGNPQEQASCVTLWIDRKRSDHALNSTYNFHNGTLAHRHNSNNQISPYVPSPSDRSPPPFPHFSLGAWNLDAWRGAAVSTNIRTPNITVKKRYK